MHSHWFGVAELLVVLITVIALIGGELIGICFVVGLDLPPIRYPVTIPGS